MRKNLRISVAAVLCAFGFSLIANAQPTPPTIKVQTLASPVRSVRIWTGALSPNPRGGWNFITQAFNYGATGAKPDWIVLDLEADKVVNTVSLPGYANSNFNLANQLRAVNGRIFFPVQGTRFCYYEPLEETVKQTAPLFPEPAPGQRGPSFFYRVEIGPDGMLYAGTQSNDGYGYLATLNPDTLEYKIFPKINEKPRAEMLTYAYRLAIDPPWVYAAVGQGDWSLVAVNTQSGESHVLAEVPKPYVISFNNREQIRATITSEYVPEPDVKDGTVKGNAILYPTRKQKAEYFWLADGKMLPAELAYDASKFPFTPLSKKVFPPLELKKTAPYAFGVPPEVDMAKLSVNAQGSVDVPWRPTAGEAKQGEWRTAHFTTDHVAPINLESLVALPDGSLFGNAQQYNGFFRYYPADGKVDYFGKTGVSRPEHVLMDGKDYYCGYPNSHLYVYDPARPWSAAGVRDTALEANPRTLGEFGSHAGTHYAYFLIPAGNGRLYFGGRRERRNQGTGIGYYEPATGKFFGLPNAMEEITPRGMVLLEKLGRIVVSGEINDGKTPETALRVYDLDLNAVETAPLKPGLKNTGALYDIGADSRFIGRIEDAKAKTTSYYLYDLAEKKIVRWVDVKGAGGPVIRCAEDGTLWVIMDATLHRLDPATLAMTPVAVFDRPLGRPEWVGRTLYGTIGAELVRAEVK